ncbi:MAG: GGDEF domain-containing protein [Azospirillaceae bacterium]|nr:GGDEF domain-containing protein [Azospirillaceae bacterium]
MILNLRGFWPRYSLRSVTVRINIIAIALVLAGLIGRIIFLTPELEKQVLTLSASHELSIGRYVARDLGTKMMARTELLVHLAAHLPRPLLTDPEGLTAWLVEWGDLNPLFSHGFAVLALKDHAVITEYPTLPGNSEIDLSQPDWLFEAARSRRTTIARPTRGKATGEPIILIAAPILDPDGKPLAILVGMTAIAAPDFLGVLQEARIGDTGSFLVISPKDGVFVAGTDPARILAPLPKPGVNALHDRAMAGFRGTGMAINNLGEEELSAVVSVPATDWFLVARLPASEIFRGVTEIRHFMMRNSVVIATVAITFLMVAVPRFLRPLTRASQAIHRMATGETPLAALPTGNADEVGELVRGFNFLVARLQENEARLAHIAHHDTLTGLPNRTLFDAQVDQAITHAQQSGTSFALLFIDLDGFKPINDSHGHEIGDSILCQIADRLRQHIRQSDSIARYGGDEFLVLLNDLDDPQANAPIAAAALQDVISKPFEIGTLTLRVGLSIGIAIFPDHGTDAQTLCSHADQAMYRAKKSGANRIVM